MKPPALPQRTARLGYAMAVAPRDGQLLDLRHQRRWVYGFWCRVNHAWLDQHGRKLYGVDKWRPS